MKLPENITVNTGDQHLVQPKVDQFIVDTVKAIKSIIKGDDHDFWVDSAELADGPNHVTDNRVTYLKYRNQVVAVVLETRTEFNRVRYDFFQNLEGVVGPEDEGGQ